MVAMAEGTRSVGAKTLENLDHQGGAFLYGKVCVCMYVCMYVWGGGSKEGKE